MNHRLTFAEILNALGLPPQSSMHAADGAARAIVSLHALIANPTTKPGSVKTAKRMLLRLLEGHAGESAGVEAPNATRVFKARAASSQTRRLKPQKTPRARQEAGRASAAVKRHRWPALGSDAMASPA